MEKKQALNRKVKKDTMFGFTPDMNFEHHVECTLNNIVSNIGDFIKHRRNELNLSIREVNRRSGVSTAVISDVESGKSMPRMEIILKLAMVLDVPLEELFGAFVPRTYKITSYQEQERTLDGMLQRMGLTSTDVKEIMQFIEFKKSIRKK